MEAKRDLEFNIYTSINNKNKIIANINYNKNKNNYCFLLHFTLKGV